jgi:subtilase family serine protease
MPARAADAGGASPAATNGYVPSDLRSAYGLPSSGGNGRIVAIVDAYDLMSAASDVAIYRAQFGLPPCTVASGCFKKVDQRGGTAYPKVNIGWDGEIELDMDMVSAICPDCKILLVEADTDNLADLAAAVDTAVSLGAVAVSNSYGGYEWPTEAGQDTHYDHPGVAITASTGDYGYADGVEYPASSPYVMSVGGTSLKRAANARGWTETVWGTSPTLGTGSGCSAYELKPYWQTDAGCTHKTTADISAVADPTTGVEVFDSTSGGWQVFGGTSVAAPLVAAALALAGRPAVGSYPSRLLYDHAADLWDVTSGHNGSCGNYLCAPAAP